jgi:hypothetical protein
MYVYVYVYRYTNLPWSSSQKICATESGGPFTVTGICPALFTHAPTFVPWIKATAGM